MKSPVGGVRVMYARYGLRPFPKPDFAERLSVIISTGTWISAILAAIYYLEKMQYGFGPQNEVSEFTSFLLASFILVWVVFRFPD